MISTSNFNFYAKIRSRLNNLAFKSVTKISSQINSSYTKQGLVYIERPSTFFNIFFSVKFFLALHAGNVQEKPVSLIMRLSMRGGHLSKTQILLYEHGTGIFKLTFGTC